MKKIFLLFMTLLTLSGCGSMMNTPTKEVENFLSKYQKQDDSVLRQLENVLVSDNTMNDTQKEDYKALMKRQYQSLTYKIKDETIDGDNATIEVEIEVFDYMKAYDDADNYLISNNQEFMDDNGNVDDSKFMDYKISKMKEVKDRVTYTLNLTLTKKDKEWTMDNITEADRQKIHGTYKS